MEPPDPDYILRGFDGPVTSLAFMPNSWHHRCDGVTYLVAGTQTGSLFVWNLKTRRVIHRMMSVHANSVLSITVLGGGDGEVLSQGREGVVIRWKLLAVDNWLKISTYPCGDLGFAPVAVLRLGNKLLIAASTSEQSHVAVMPVDGGEMITTLKPQQTVGMVMDIKAGGEDHIMAGYEDGSIVVWDVRFPRHEKNSARLHTEAMSSLDYCEQTRRGVSASVDGSLIAWGGTELNQTATADIKGGAACVRARPDGKLFAVGGCDSRIHIFSGRPKLSLLAVIGAHTQSVQSLAFNDCDQTFAAGSRDKTVSMWSIYKDS